MVKNVWDGQIYSVSEYCDGNVTITQVDNPGYYEIVTLDYLEDNFVPAE